MRIRAGFALILVGAFGAAALLSCAREAPRSEAPVTVPLPEDLGGFDPEITEQIEDRAERVRRSPRDGRRWRDLGMLYQTHRQLELAVTCYRQSRKLAPRDPRTAYYQALVERRLGQPEALEVLDAAIRLAPDYLPARWRLGLWRLEDGDPAAARSVLQEAHGQAPEDRAVTLILARTHSQLAEPETAAELLDAYLAARPDDRYAHFLLGGAYRRLGRSDAAQHHLGLGQGADPEWRDPWLDELEDQRVGFSAALEAATELLGREPARAVAELEKLHDQRPDNGTVLINLGIGHRRLGRLDDSIRVLEEAVEREPTRGLAHFHLAVSLSQKPDTAGATLRQALAHARQAVELQPTSARSHALEGELLAQSGQLGPAIESFRRAVRDPQDPAWLYRLGELLCQLQRWDEAIPVLENLRERQGDDPRTLFLLGAAQANAGRLDEARAALERARALQPEDPQIQQALTQLDQARRARGGRVP